MQAIIDFFLKLFGLKAEESSELKWVKDKIKEKEEELEKIDEENHSIDDINNHFNK